MESKKERSIVSTYKSQDTEEWLDIHFTRPIGFWWAKFFDRFGIHPNTVTVLSIVLGVAAGYMFYFPDWMHNVAGVVLLMWANFYDSADGQLARMTGKKTQLGRILDGVAGDLWFISIYAALCLRLMDTEIPGTDIRWRYWIFFVAGISGFIFHTKQCQLADYYRNIHLYFLKGEAGSELDNSQQQKEIWRKTPWKGNFWWRIFLWFYIDYTRSQERMTPCFQRLKAYIREQRGGQITEQIRKTFCRESLPLMKYANILTFNCRAIILYIVCLADCPWVYFFVEMTVFAVLAGYMRHRHEHVCSACLVRWEAEEA